MALNLNELINRRLSRRDMLKRSAFITAGAILPLEFFKLPLSYERANNAAISKVNKAVSFDPISPSSEDKLILPDGFDYTIIRKWGDKISETEDYGYNNDFVTFMPLDNNPDDGLLAVNHEFPTPLFVSGYSDEDLKNKKLKTPEQINAERKCVGMSVFRVKRVNGKWEFTEDSTYNRRYDADTPILLSGAAAGTPEVMNATTVRGTLANCSGGVTPWKTVLSGEENYQDYATNDGWSYRWTDNGEEFIEEHYGWVVEIDPYDKNAIPKKRTSLGRFHHENVGVVISPAGNAVAYMGDDKVNECVYKFVSANRYNADDLAANKDILDEGNLYAADFINNKWQLLDISRAELSAVFKSQADVLVNCEKASKLVGGTECNRPEDIEINPADNSVFVSFTNNSKKKDYFGSIVRIIEKDNDPASLEFTWEVFATGGTASGFSCPDNLTFDNKGNLWVLCDISTEKLNKGDQAPFKNNAMFMIPTTGENKGKAFQFASGPVDCEMCGGNFSPDYSTMFLSIQHPGENSTDINNPTSRWPNGGDDTPRPAVIAITGFNK